MLLDLVNGVQRPAIFDVLSRVDVELAGQVKRRGCQLCGGPLHDAHYNRKPRGGPVLPVELSRRLSLCCGHCRRRALPPSCLFWGRRVYWRVVILVAVALRQGPESFTIARLGRVFGVSRQTMKRWMGFFEDRFPTSATWQRLRGRLRAGAAQVLPLDLLGAFVDAAPDIPTGLARCAAALAHRGASELAQKMGSPTV